MKLKNNTFFHIQIVVDDAGTLWYRYRTQFLHCGVLTLPKRRSQLVVQNKSNT